MYENPKAKIFISCGQKELEREIAFQLEKKVIEKLNFECYVAIRQQSLRSLKENVFSQLENSEYFIFIDFAREKLENGKNENRGSLFSHQELAIAAFLDLETIIFREENTRIEGILKFVQGNPITFSNRDKIVESIIDEIIKRKWKPTWKNALTISGQNSEDAYTTEYGGTRFFQLKIKNSHKQKIARNCCAFIEKIKGISKETVPRLVELKWSGTTIPSVTIPPGKERYLDAFYIPKNNINYSENVQISFQSYSDSTFFKNPINPYGPLEITYLIVSENFPPLKCSCKINVGKRYQDYSIETIKSTHG